MIHTVDGQHFSCNLWSEIIHLEGAEALAAYSGDYVAGGPAVTRHAYGKGTSYYLSTSLEPAGQSWLVDYICRETGVQRLDGFPQGVEAIRRRSATDTFLFLLNYSGEYVRVKLPPEVMTGNARDLITGAPVAGEIQLDPTAVAVVQFPAQP